MKGRKLIRHCCTLLVWALSLASCQVERPETVMTDAKMEAVLYDYHIARAMGEEVPYEENYKRVLYVESVFKKHGITQADFDTSMVWFARNPEVLSKIYEKVNQKLRTERDHINKLIAIRDNKPRESQSGDSIDVWMWQRIYQLTGMPLDNKITFSFSSDSNFYDRDTLCWNVRFRFEERSDTFNVPVMALQIHYESDSLVSKVSKIKTPGAKSIALSADTLGPIKEIRGFVFYPLQEGTNPLLMDRISLMRYHATDSLTFSVDTVPLVDKEKETISTKNMTPKSKQVTPQPIQKKHESPRLRMETKKLEKTPSFTKPVEAKK